MDAIERLKSIGSKEIYKRTHIPVAEIDAILDKNFDYFTRAKALGFIKIVEREYEVDLSFWIAEFEDYKADKQESEQIFVVAKEEAPSKIKVAIVAVVALVVFGIAVAGFLSDRDKYEEQIVAPKPVVEEAREIVENKQELVAVEETESEPEATQEPEIISQLTVESKEELWIGIYYIDTKERAQQTLNGKTSLDRSRDQVITFGHGRFKMTFDDRTFEPNSGALQRFRLKDGVLTQMVVTPSKPEESEN